jgi:katanin p60 ATPase-containing subunit A1
MLEMMLKSLLVHVRVYTTLQSNYQGPDAELAAMLENDVMDHSPGVRWTDIAGLADGKRVLEEAAVLPLMMPEYFTGIRKPVKVTWSRG